MRRTKSLPPLPHSLHKVPVNPDESVGVAARWAGDALCEGTPDVV